MTNKPIDDPIIATYKLIKDKLPDAEPMAIATLVLAKSVGTLSAQLSILNSMMPVLRVEKEDLN